MPPVGWRHRRHIDVACHHLSRQPSSQRYFGVTGALQMRSVLPDLCGNCSGSKCAEPMSALGLGVVFAMSAVRPLFLRSRPNSEHRARSQECHEATYISDEAPHQILSQNHERIVAKQWRFHTARVRNGPPCLGRGLSGPPPRAVIGTLNVYDVYALGYKSP